MLHFFNVSFFPSLFFWKHPTQGTCLIRTEDSLFYVVPEISFTVCHCPVRVPIYSPADTLEERNLWWNWYALGGRGKPPNRTNDQINKTQNFWMETYGNQQNG